MCVQYLCSSASEAQSQQASARGRKGWGSVGGWKGVGVGVPVSRPIRRARVLDGEQQWKPRETDGSVQHLLVPLGVDGRAKSQTWR